MTSKPTTAVIIAAVVAFVAVLAAYVALAMTGHADDAAGIVPIVTTLLGLVGLGAHQSSRLSKQDEQLSTISHQTNGVLTARIEQGADAALRRVLRETGYNVPDPAPVPPTGPQDVEGSAL